MQVQFRKCCTCKLSINKGDIMSISDIEVKGPWYYVLDGNGKRTASMAVSSVGELLGFSGNLIVCSKGPWYYSYDATGKKIGTGAVSSVGDFKNVAGSVINFKKGPWISSYDEKFKKQGTRPA
jgi:hypothetical protein